MAQDGDDLLVNEENEEVGYGRPPKKDRIKAGEVRNPWGRKGKPGPKKDFMDGLIQMRVDGVLVWVTRDESLDYALYNVGIKGRVSAIRELERRRQERARAAADSATSDALSSEDQAALERYVQRRMQESHASADMAQSQNAVGRQLGCSPPSARR